VIIMMPMVSVNCMRQNTIITNTFHPKCNQVVRLSYNLMEMDKNGNY
jgi:hypothetical protein